MRTCPVAGNLIKLILWWGMSLWTMTSHRFRAMIFVLRAVAIAIIDGWADPVVKWHQLKPDFSYLKQWRGVLFEKLPIWYDCTLLASYKFKKCHSNFCVWMAATWGFWEAHYGKDEVKCASTGECNQFPFLCWLMKQGVKKNEGTKIWEAIFSQGKGNTSFKRDTCWEQSCLSIFCSRTMNRTGWLQIIKIWRQKVQKQ